ncbi:alpha-hydroxy-acid oxidizing protein [Gelria sp. Kuro-4]|uniref:alpha-hydroxy-acid oxidizing protein n=1 Tax=Gelria sp. Kuro-4 TaxID=2796927 RepID=UPI001BED4C87|nr:alpha-hydroxy-acid oxidizing protein [Gelria sp. Kuro-4]BCV26049.1 alpha-hydroxy-acid oxidizing enzyme [Gelria sp. Kuro-4]
MTGAAMGWEEVRSAAREKLLGVCSLCRVCDGRVCAGQVPGMGGVGTGTSAINNYEALRAIKLNLRTLHAATEPELSVTLFGKTLALPVLGAPVAGAKVNFQGRILEWEFTLAQVQGAREAGTLACTGDGAEPEEYAMGLKALQAVGGRGIPVIKPRPAEEILRRIRLAEDAGAVAVGIDVDAAGLMSMRRAGVAVGPLAPDVLTRICSATRLSVIVKGVMTADEARLAYECGAAGIVVSNHGGRVLDYTPGTAEVLPSVAAEVKGKLTLLADGGVRSGVDVLKFLALGADAVLVGRPAAWAAFGGGAEGVRFLYRKLAEELRAAMILTGCPSPAAAGPALLA